MVFQIHCSATLVLRGREQTRIARTSVFRPRLHAEREDCNPLLRDDLLQIHLCISTCLPCHCDITLTHRHAVASKRVNIDSRLAFCVCDIFRGTGRSLFFKRKRNALFVQFSCSLFASPAEFILSHKETDFGSIEPQIRSVCRHYHIGITAYGSCLAGHVGTDADTGIVAVCIGKEHLFPARIVVAVHVVYDVRSHAMVSPVVVYKCGTVLCRMHVCIVSICCNHSCRYGLLCLCL